MTRPSDPPTADTGTADGLGSDAGRRGMPALLVPEAVLSCSAQDGLAEFSPARTG